jgi:hypothetical protein
VVANYALIALLCRVSSDVTSAPSRAPAVSQAGEVTVAG